MLRRVVSHARRLGIEGPVLEPLVELTVERFGHVYPELRENQAFVLQVATSEEERFSATLRQGLHAVRGGVEQSGRARSLSGDDAFKLSDTFGFPLQLTEELAADAGLRSTCDRFAELLDEQRTRARGRREEGARSASTPERCRPPSSSGYTAPGGRRADRGDARRRQPRARRSRRRARRSGSSSNVTPFYAEGGGQIGDHGHDPHRRPA